VPDAAYYCLDMLRQGLVDRSWHHDGRGSGFGYLEGKHARLSAPAEVWGWQLAHLNSVVRYDTRRPPGTSFTKHLTINIQQAGRISLDVGQRTLAVTAQRVARGSARSLSQELEFGWCEHIMEHMSAVDIRYIPAGSSGASYKSPARRLWKNHEYALAPRAPRGGLDLSVVSASWIC